MSNKITNNDSGSEILTKESARQRWDLFHRAIAHAKAHSRASTSSESPGQGIESRAGKPRLSVVR